MSVSQFSAFQLATLGLRAERRDALVRIRPPRRPSGLPDSLHDSIRYKHLLYAYAYMPESCSVDCLDCEGEGGWVRRDYVR